MNLTAPVSKAVIPPSSKVYNLQSESKMVFLPCIQALRMSDGYETLLDILPALAHLVADLFQYESVSDSESLFCSVIMNEGYNRVMPPPGFMTIICFAAGMPTWYLH